MQPGRGVLLRGELDYPAPMHDFEEVLTFWFGDLDARGMADEAHAKRWWVKDEAFDQEIRDRFAALHEAIVEGGHQAWLESPRGRLAHVIVLDQFSRNMFRGSPKMFAQDELALRVAREGIEAGVDRSVAHAERSFFYLPLMHSEALDVQERCVELFRAWHDALDGTLKESVASSLDFAVQHRDIVLRFGRFPHRNAVLGRPSTAEELEFLQQPGSSF
jgi:uncharacterized protein (DUF924 family)